MAGWKILLLISLCALGSVLTMSWAQAQDSPLEAVQRQQRQVFARVAPSVVFITHDEGLGSGFFVSRDGTILTNAHVIGERSTVSVVLHDGRRFQGEVLERAEELDLAIITVELDDASPLALAGMDDVEVGDWAAAVGHGAGGIWTFTTGMVSNIYPRGEDRPVFQTQIPLNPGGSGGPVVNLHGEAIGVVTAGIVEAQSINFAIPVQQAIAHLPALAERCDCLIIELPDATPIYVDGVMVGTGPRLIVMAEPREYEVVAVVDGIPQRRQIMWPQTRLIRFGE